MQDVHLISVSYTKTAEEATDSFAPSANYGQVKFRPPQNNKRRRRAVLKKRIRRKKAPSASYGQIKS
ncbi:MAG: hypothetical protein J6E31_04960 [Pyramidobacter sp.]|nr:hypothetical protein [Pyramidobacter sp.]